MAFVPPARHLLRAKDLADARYSEPLTVDDLARAARLSRAHFSREFRRAFGESPHAYLLTRRLERAAALLRNTDRSVTEICFAVGLQSVGSFTTSFTRTYGMPPTAYRESFPPASDYALILLASSGPTCDRNTARFEKAPARLQARMEGVQSTEEESMYKIATAQVWVHDQDEALDFYTKKLGLEVRSDVTVAEMGNFRWLTVGPADQPDVSIVLMAIPGPPVMDEQTAEQVKSLMSKGFAGTVFFTTDNVQADYEELKSRGVEFTEEPTEMPYGIDSAFRDPSGNNFRLTQVREMAAV
jgi:AraC-like DNA-binding protein/predicted enzyme related to lactoylglutathione lyase